MACPPSSSDFRPPELGGDERLASPWRASQPTRESGAVWPRLLRPGHGWAGVGKGGLLSRSAGRAGRPLCVPAVQVQPRSAGDFLPQRDGGGLPRSVGQAEARGSAARGSAAGRAAACGLRIAFGAPSHLSPPHALTHSLHLHLGVCVGGPGGGARASVGPPGPGRPGPGPRG